MADPKPFAHTPNTDELTALFDRFDDLQQSHLEIFSRQDENDPDFALQCFDRARLFQELKNQLNQAVRDPAPPPEIARLCRERIGKLRQIARLITASLEQNKNAMLIRQRRMHQGKRALNGYRHSSAGAAPRFVSKNS